LTTKPRGWSQFIIAILSVRLVIYCYFFKGNMLSCQISI